MSVGCGAVMNQAARLLSSSIPWLRLRKVCGGDCPIGHKKTPRGSCGVWAEGVLSIRPARCRCCGYLRVEALTEFRPRPIALSNFRRV